MSYDTAPDLHTEIFTPAADEDATADGRFTKWLDAEGIGFHEGTFDPEDIPTYLAAYRADQRVLWGVHDRAQPAEALGADHPVATYGTMVHSLNVGAGLVEAHQITAVTVRSSHRRNGILRSMMTRDLGEAAERGLPLAILTASEATIYGRFGFGCATFTQSVEVDVRERFEVTAPRTGTTTLVAREHAVRLAQQIFDGFHASTFGSVDRQYAYPRRASGEWGRERPIEDRNVRFAVHYDATGTPAGYVSYRFAGWETTPYTMKIVDLVASTPSAYLELWRYLGSLDLVQVVTWDGARRDDALPWSLRDRRCYSVKGTDDVLWVRMLDVPAALGARSYRGSGRIVLDVLDPLGIAGGSFVLTVVDGVAQVEHVDTAAAPDATLTVNALGSLYLGGVQASALAAAGALTAHADDAVDLLDTLFGLPQEPYCITHF
ncbi:GNAT family N-acetyltransferase [Arthrobacter agilis]|uniref:GNAT family N-acetyltransferase n=1 Tax=Arthrobacter agilis TaxID=37921 RepID=UPI000B359F46|nr:GNAT family N-acetyltransferase [Arthrobacter agilis]OUM44556.1 GNAT family N-acetyltransferase [Arthrobacter agilis]PPB47592.1 GNAT family N-acetyltransferase [Arthrobacter agilis]TPV22749.1 GNAT family N-acetyltransferase [Arthrobacter agilis]VDR31993.1 Enhanced intracellular survival protein [Arthrobacter agilis]